MTNKQQSSDFQTLPFVSIQSCGRARPFARRAHDVDLGVRGRISARAGRGVMLAVLIAACCVSLGRTAAAQEYRVIFLVDLGGSSRGNSINNRGWVAGFSRLTSGTNRHATLWRDGAAQDLGTLGGPDKNSSVVWPVKNNRGVVVGISQTDTPEPNNEAWSCSAFFGGQTGYTCLGFTWIDGVMKPLPPLAGGNNSFATGANNQTVVGWAENGVRDTTCVGRQVLQFLPVTWDLKTSQVQALPLLTGDTSGAATAVNNKGQIVGISGICDQAVGRHTARHAVLWDKGTVTKIGDLGVRLWNTPMAINQRGDIVGFVGTDPDDLDGNYLHAFFWSRGEGFKEIAPLPLPGHVYSQANGVNERGQVVGSSCTLDGDCRAFFWARGVLKNLKDLAPGFNGEFINAQDINDEGEITGRALDPATGRIRPFVAVPVAGGEDDEND